jgi:hypothetical protein
MTGPCSGAGVGVAKSGFASLQYIGPGAIGGALAGLSGWQGAAVGATIGALTYDLTTFCPGGPPAMPTFTVSDIVALLSPIPTADRATAALKFQDFLGNVFWPLLCDCSSGTSTIGALSTYPSGGPQTNANTSPAAACADTGSVALTAFDLHLGSGNWSSTDFRGLNATSVQLTTRKTPAGAGPHGNITWIAHWQVAPSGTFLYETSYTHTNDGVDHVYNIPIPAGAGYVVWEFTCTANQTDTANARAQFFCNYQAPIAVPCCPPDPALVAQVNQIYQMVTLIQRQSAPFGYVYGTNHAGLTGSGELTVADLIGVSVDVTTNPGYTGLIVGDPATIFKVGRVNLGTADGWTVSRDIDHDGSLVLPAQAGVFTKIGYTLNPGVVVAIRELVREP